MRLLLRRLADAALLYLLVVTLTFLLLRAAPGDPARLLVPPTATAADAERLRAELGLDAPLVVQYARWTSGVLTGDLGESFASRRPVGEVLGDALPVSLGLGLVSLALTFLVGVTLGAIQAARRGTALDATLTVATTAIFAAPSFWLALSLIALFTYGAAVWGLPPALRLPAFGMRDPASETEGLAALGDIARHAVLPVLTLSAIGAAGIARYSRTILADLMDLPFVRTARAKGAPRSRVYTRHVLRPALPPLIVLFALSLPGVLAGSVFVESVFAWPGMGRLMVTAIGARDYPVVMGATVLYAGLVILANLLGDLVLPLADPRRRE